MSNILSRAECSVYAHSLINPPSLTSSCDVNLTLSNSEGRLSLIKRGVNLQTEYLLSINDPSSLGLMSSVQNAVDNFMKNLVIAMNLHLQRAALSIVKGNVTQPDVQFKPESQVIMEEKLEGKHITITETVFGRDTFHIIIGFNEQIDENKAFSTLKQINRLNVEESTENIKKHNLRKSLMEYEEAMKIFDRLMIFKHLFNSLELATNWDGCDRKGLTFDEEVESVIGYQASEVRKWRDFYNRTKHVDREPKDIADFVQGMENLPLFIEPLRLGVNAILINRLERI